MDAKDYLSGVYLDSKKFSKKETIELMEDYFKYKTEYNKQLVKKLPTKSLTFITKTIIKHGNIY